jgi:hypothetical protein
MISYTISKSFLTFDIEGHYRDRYRIRYSIHPMSESFTAERKLPLPRRHHAGAEGSQHHEPWIPSPSSCGIPQLDPQRFDEETSFHSALIDVTHKCCTHLLSIHDQEMIKGSAASDLAICKSEVQILRAQLVDISNNVIH